MRGGSVQRPSGPRRSLTPFKPTRHALGRSGSSGSLSRDDYADDSSGDSSDRESDSSDGGGGQRFSRGPLGRVGSGGRSGGAPNFERQLTRSDSTVPSDLMDLREEEERESDYSYGSSAGQGAGGSEGSKLTRKLTRLATAARKRSKRKDFPHLLGRSLLLFEVRWGQKEAADVNIYYIAGLGWGLERQGRLGGGKEGVLGG